MSELSCGTRFICRNETLDLSLYQPLESTLRVCVKYALSSCPGQLPESGLGSKRANTDRAVDPELKNREISFLTRILGRMTPICIFKHKTPNIVHKGPV